MAKEQSMYLEKFFGTKERAMHKNTMIELNMVHDRILVKPDNPEETTRGGLVLPDSAKMNALYLTGVVLAVGPGNPNVDGTMSPVCVKPGQRILYPHRLGNALTGMEVTVNGEKLWIISNTTVMAILTEVPKFVQG
jgi:chaperonin GroES